MMETYKDEPSILGPRTYTHKWHIQTNIPMTIVEDNDGKQKVVDEECASRTKFQTTYYCASRSEMPAAARRAHGSARCCRTHPYVLQRALAPSVDRARNNE